MLLTTALALCGAGAGADEAAPPVDQLSPQTDATGRVVYEPGFFARYAPSTALDMVNRVPGFTIDNGDDRRGFSGAAGNVLIDGEPPSSKSDTATSILSRIPADQVLRIELLRGAAGEAGVQSTLVNVVRAPSGGSGVWEAEGEYNIERNRFAPRGSLSWSGRVGDFEYGVGINRFLQYRDLSGVREFRTPAGALTGVRPESSARSYRETVPTANAAFPFLGGRLRLNAQWQRWEFQTIHDTPLFDPGGVQQDDEHFFLHEREQAGELGMTFTRGLGPVDLEIISLLNRAHYADDQFVERATPAGALVSRTDQSTRHDTGESILRGVATWTLNPRHRLQIGAEGAFNSLEQALTLVRDTGSGPVAVDLPSANVLVEEERAELFLTHVWRPSAGWSLETTLAQESSTLSQTGDVDLETELTYFKPSVRLTRTLGRNQLRLRYYRDVDQLDFGDFVSAAQLSDSLVGGGNPNLRPETSWRLEAGADFRFGADGALGVTLFHHDIEDAADVVPVTVVPPPPATPITFDAPGNIGGGERYGIELTAALPLGFLLPGARLTLEAKAQEGEVTDPVTLRPRTISELQETEVEAEFRQDIPSHRFAWGVSYYKSSEFTVFRRNEEDTPEEGPFVDIYAESTAISGLKLRVVAANITDAPISRARRFYTPDRAGGFASLETRDRRLGPFVIVSVSGTF